MNKFWQVVKFEYLRHVRQKRFIFALLSLPIFAVVMILITVLVMTLQLDKRPAGYIDRSGYFPSLQAEPENSFALVKSVNFLPFTAESDARAALDSGQIQAYFIIDPDYLNNGKVLVFVLDKLSENAISNFSSCLRYNLALRVDSAAAKRLSEGNVIITQSLDGSRSISDDNILGFILPLSTGFLFMIAINTSGGYLLQALVEEKENRTMEIMITSIAPKKLMAAKTLGNLAVGLTQMLVWMIFGWLTVLLLQMLFPSLGSFQADAFMLWIMIATFLPAFVFIGALMATVGALSVDHREAQQVAGLFTLPVIIPYWFMLSLMQYPNSALSIGLSLFPFTAPISLPIRAAFTSVPAWQILLSIAVLLLCASGAIWLAGKAFQVGMLRYGKRVPLKEILRRKEKEAGS